MRGFLIFAALAPGLLLVGSCGDDDGAPVPTNTSSSSATAPVAPTTAGGPTPGDPAVAQTLAQSPQYILYTVRAGDTLAGVAAAFAGAPGGGPLGFAARIGDLNKVTATSLAAGQLLAVPLVLTGDLSMMAEASFEAALGVGGTGGKLVLLQPSLAMREGYIGRLVLHSVELATGSPATAGYGYIMEYWLADRPPIKGGDVDPDARVSEPAFRVAAGSLAPPGAADGASFVRERDGVRYVVTALKGAKRSAKELAEMLQTAKER